MRLGNSPIILRLLWLLVSTNFSYPAVFVSRVLYSPNTPMSLIKLLTDAAIRRRAIAREKECLADSPAFDLF